MKELKLNKKKEKINKLMNCENSKRKSSILNKIFPDFLPCKYKKKKNCVTNYFLITSPLVKFSFSFLFQITV